MSNVLRLEKSGRVAKLIFDRPDQRNAMGFGSDPGDFLARAAELNADESISCVILTGAGKAFSAGGDVKQLREWAHQASMHPKQLLALYEQGIHHLVQALWSLEMPVIAAINGAAIGLGNDLACLADIRIAAASAKFGATFLKIGLVPGDGGAWLLPRVIGWDRAAELYFTGKVIDAETALAYRLVTQVVDDAELMATAEALAASICEQPPQVLRLTKKLMRAGIEQSFPEVMSLSAAYQVLAHLTDDHREALDAMHDKRPAVFTGR
ncbi:MAG: Enoyl-CoA hydratase/isomerase [Alphaproteobacteria bacterium]|nr:Enoyl-CoA hydratase/isomerase [Alphaproteobacteria bacterium]